MLTFPREIPFRNEGPKYMVELTDNYHKWLYEDSSPPKLYIDVKPGFFAQGIRKMLEARPMPHLKTAKAKGLHFLQEDDPDTVGKAIVAFLTKDVFPKSK